MGTVAGGPRAGAGRGNVTPRTARPIGRVRLAVWLTSAGALLLAFALASRTQADPDLWGHVRFGMDILHERGLTSVDPYSFTQDRPWINHEWLSEIMMGGAYLAFGSTGLALLKGLMTFGTLAVIWGGLRGMAFGPRLIAMALAVIGTAQIFQTLRPQLWSFLGLALLWRLVQSSEARRHWWLPLLFVIWANSHGGWFVGIVVLGVWAAGRSLEDRRQLPRWAALIGACLLATLLNPYGWGLWAFLLETVRLTRPEIEEWRPLWAFPPTRWLPWIMAVGASIWFARPPVPDRWTRLAVAGVLAFAALRVVRVSPLFVESAVMLLAPALAWRWPVSSSGARIGATRAEQVTATVLFVATSAAAVAVGSTSLACVEVTRDGMPERMPVAILQSAGPGRLVTFFNWGEYALWHLGAQVQVSIDGRRETVYSQRRLDDHDAILFGRPGAAELLTQWQPEYVWLPRQSGIARDWLNEAQYRIAWESEVSYLAVRPDLPALSLPSDVEPTGRRCFPD